MSQYSFNAPLVSGDYTKLRSVGAGSSYGGKEYISVLPNTVVFAARFNSAQSGNSFAQEEWHSASVGAYTDALPGQLFLAAASNNPQLAYFTGRVRKAFGATTAYFNETSIAQAGGDYFWVIDDYPIMDKLLRALADQPAGSPIYRADYDLTYRPLLPFVGSANDAIQLHGAYAGFVNGSNKFRISISAKFYPSESAATISSWSVNIVDGTLISGSLTGSGTTTGTITIDFPPGFRHILITVTNSAGVSNTCAVKVWAETRSGSPTLITGFNGASINIDMSTSGGQLTANPMTCSLEMFTDELAETLDNTPICVWDEEYLDETLGSVGGNVRFIGRLRKESNQAKMDQNYVRTLKTSWTLEGPDTQLARLDPKNMLISIVDNITPSDWGQVKSLTLYKAIALLLTEFCTFTQGQVVNIDPFDDTFPYPALNTAGSTPVGIINDLANSINAMMQFTGDGRAKISRHAFMVSNSDRSNFSTVANWAGTDRTSDLDLTRDDLPNIIQVDAWGGEDTGAQQVTPLHSQAPGLAPDRGERQIPFLKQVLANVGIADAQLELNDRAGCMWQKEANPFRLSSPHMPSYGFLWPDISAWFTETIPASDNLRGYTYDTATRWILEKISFTHDNKAGIKKITPGYLKETNGNGMGNTIPIITNNTLPADTQSLALGVFPLTQPVTPSTDLPGPDAAMLKSGIKKLGLILTDGKIIKTSNFQQSPPTWDGGTSLGVSGTVVRPVPDFFSGRYAGLSSLAYWWIITATGEYYGDVTTPSFALGHTFRSSNLLRSAFASLKAAGHIAQAADYSDGVWANAGTAGTLGSESQLNASPGARSPGMFTTLDGTIYTSIVGQIYKSIDNGSTWSAVSGTSTGSDTAASIASSLNGKYIYYGKIGSSFTNNYDFTAGQQGFVSSHIMLNSCVYTPTPYTPGQGWGYYGCINTTGGPPTQGQYAEIDLNVSTPLAITSMSATVVATGTLGGGSSVQIWVDGVLVATTSFSTAGTYTVNYSGSITANSMVSFTTGITNIPNDGTVYITSGSISNSSSGVPSLQRFDGSSSIDVSPAAGFGPWLENQISVLPNNPLVLVVGAGNSGQSITGIWISQDGGLAWLPLIAPSNSNPYWAGFLAGDGSIVYLVGSGHIATINLNGTGLSDKTGNLVDTARIVGLAGL